LVFSPAATQHQCNSFFDAGLMLHIAEAASVPANHRCDRSRSHNADVQPSLIVACHHLRHPHRKRNLALAIDLWAPTIARVRLSAQ
jgi:hypothetical protein